MLSKALGRDGVYFDYHTNLEEALGRRGVFGEIRWAADLRKPQRDHAEAVYQRWGSWGNYNAMRAASNDILTEYLPSRRAQLDVPGELPSAQPVAAPIKIGSVDFNPASSGASSDQSREYFTLGHFRKP